MASPPASASASATELELARARCRALHDHVAAAPSLRRQPALRSLLRLVGAELCFLRSSRAASPLSSNLPHLAALHLLLTHPAVRSPSRLNPLPGVEFACAFRSLAAWALLSARNPARLPWAPRALPRARVLAVLDAARKAPPATSPECLLLVFARGVGVDVARGLAEEFGAVETDLLGELAGESEVEEEEGWVSVVSFHLSEARMARRQVAAEEASRRLLFAPFD